MGFASLMLSVLPALTFWRKHRVLESTDSKGMLQVCRTASFLGSDVTRLLSLFVTRLPCCLSG